MTRYIPQRGDALWITLDPRIGHEQAGRRPVLVLTSATYNSPSELMVACPIGPKVTRLKSPFRLA